jgi:site-specific recombinase XerD
LPLLLPWFLEFFLKCRFAIALSLPLKKINHKSINLKQIRNSVVVNWLRQHNLRKVQYLAGHRYISSTERYQQDDLESLHKTINIYHPFS